MKCNKITRFCAAAILSGGMASSGHATTNDGSEIEMTDLNKPVTAFPSDFSVLPPQNPTSAQESQYQTQLSNYAWRLFIAAMQQTTASLSSGKGRGVGNGINSFIDTGSTPARDNPLVFESLYHRTEAYPYYTSTKPANPTDKVPTYYTYYEGASGKVALTVENQNYVYLDETNEIGQNFLYYQHSNNANFPVLFMAKVNQQEVDYAYNQTAAPSNAQPWDFDNQTIEVKTAWRRVSDLKKSDSRDYHLASGTYYVSDEEGTAPVVHTDTFALIAIHIIQKTANYPQFIFSTFEHVDAVTRSGDTIVDPAYKLSYNYIDYASKPDIYPLTIMDTTVATPTGAYTVNKTMQPVASNSQTSYNLPSTGDVSQGYTTVKQPKTIISEVNDVNNRVNNLVLSADADNVWANYRLKGVQAVPSSDETAPNFYLANIAVESSQPGVQLFRGILLNGGLAQSGTLTNSTDTETKLLFVNCRVQDVSSSNCKYPDKSLNPSNPATDYNNVSVALNKDGSLAAPVHNMGGCQGCHGAAQQLGRDFSFLANGALGKGKELDSVPSSALTVIAAEAHNQKMALNNSGN